MSDLSAYSSLAGAALRLRSELAAALSASASEEVRSLHRDLPDTPEDASVTVTFVGAYGAGKSTIIRALTGRDDIEIGSGVTTQKASPYPWSGIELVDTPGVNAKRPDHDEETQRAIDRADLLAFVVSDELFSDVLGTYFRSLAIGQGRGREMMLVVNKMSQTGGNPRDKAADIEPVTHPFSIDDLRTVFTDAESALRARRETDRPDRAQTFQMRSNMAALEEALSEFAAAQGWLGRLTTPLVTLRRVASDAHAVIGADLPEERMALDLLRLQRRIFRTSQSRLERALTNLLNEARADLASLGDGLAEALQSDADEAAVNRKSEAAEAGARKRCDRLVEDADAAVEQELKRLDGEIEALKSSETAERLRLAGPGTPDGTIAVSVPATGPGASLPVSSPNLARIRKASEVANTLGKMAFSFASGPKAASMAWTTTAASGSQAHKTVLTVGKFFGYKFKPWGAVKAAKGIGTIGRALGAVGGVLTLVAQFAEDRQADEAERLIRTSRDDVRSGYRAMGSEVGDAFQKSIEELNASVYEPAFARLDAQTGELTGQSQNRNEEAGTFERIAGEAGDLVRRAHRSLPAPDVPESRAG